MEMPAAIYALQLLMAIHYYAIRAREGLSCFSRLSLLNLQTTNRLHTMEWHDTEGSEDDHGHHDDAQATSRKRSSRG